MPPKNIVIAFSGTGQSRRKKILRDNPGLLIDVLEGSNRQSSISQDKQVHHYVEGVGSETATYTGGALQGVFALSFPEKIQNGYQFISQQYQTGDKIFLTGFSRGAAIAVSLVNMINKIGIVQSSKATEQVLKKAYNVYLATENKQEAAEFRSQNSHSEAQITCLALYDAVLAWENQESHFHGFEIPEIVKVFRHALAADERRKSFNYLPLKPSNPDETDTEQRIFPGAHSDVGGGYRHRGLAQIAFRWMLKEMSQCGLILPQDYLATLDKFVDHYVSDAEKSDNYDDEEDGVKRQKYTAPNPNDKQHYPEANFIFKFLSKIDRTFKKSRVSQFTCDPSLHMRMSKRRKYKPNPDVVIKTKIAPISAISKDVFDTVDAAPPRKKARKTTKQTNLPSSSSDSSRFFRHQSDMINKMGNAPNSEKSSLLNNFNLYTSI